MAAFVTVAAVCSFHERSKKELVQERVERGCVVGSRAVPRR